MITGVTGILEGRGAGSVDVRVGGSVSLQIFVPSSTLENLGNQGDVVHLHTRLYMKDDEPVLYGFASAEDLRLFQMLNGVAGVGPRMSLSLLSSLGSGALITAVAAGDVDALSRVAGVGKKSAGRLVLELKGKFAALLQPGASPPVIGSSEDSEVVLALMALGYSATEARRGVSPLGYSDSLPVEDRIRRALQQIGEMG